MAARMAAIFERREVRTSRRSKGGGGLEPLRVGVDWVGGDWVGVGGGESWALRAKSSAICGCRDELSLPASLSSLISSPLALIWSLREEKSLVMEEGLGRVRRRRGERSIVGEKGAMGERRAQKKSNEGRTCIRDGREMAAFIIFWGDKVYRTRKSRARSVPNVQNLTYSKQILPPISRSRLVSQILPRFHGLQS